MHKIPHSEESKKKISESKKGKLHIWTEEARKKVSQSMRGRSNFTGHTHTEETKRKMSEAQSGPNHPAWKGDEAGYMAIHNWVRKHIPRPISCQKCGTSDRIQAHNISGEYHRDPNDWVFICPLCHAKEHSKTKV